MHLRSYPQNRSISLDNVVFSGLPEKSKFVPKLMLRQRHMTTTIERSLHCALETLGAQVSQLLSRVGLDDMQVLDQFIPSSFKPNCKQCLKTQRSWFVLLIMETLYGNNSSINSHKLINTSSPFSLHCDSIVCVWFDIQSESEDEHVIAVALRNRRTSRRRQDAELFGEHDERLVLQHFAPVVEDQMNKRRTATPNGVQFALLGLSEDNHTSERSLRHFVLHSDG
jgi:hypothetical protein